VTDEKRNDAKPELAALLRSGTGGVYALPAAADAGAAAQAADAAGRCLIRLDASAADSKAAFLDRAAASLALPAHFGRNWDALHDCLTNEQPAALGGAVLLVDGIEALAARDPETLATAIDVLRGASDYWLKMGRPLLVLLRPAEAATGVSTVAC
jgi:Barstar (barnase inhibitor)